MFIATAELLMPTACITDDTLAGCSIVTSTVWCRRQQQEQQQVHACTVLTHACMHACM